jgi:hypothetical protein
MGADAIPGTEKEIPMTRNALLLTALPFALVLGACRTPTPRDIAVAKENRVKAEQTLLRFAEAIAESDVGRATALIAPGLPRERYAECVGQVERAARIQLYEGYRLDVVAGLDRVGVWEWRRGRFRTWVPATNADGYGFEDRFAMTRVGKRWLISGLRLGQAAPTETARVGKEARKQIRAKVEEIAGYIRQERYGQILYAVPTEGRVRLVHPSWFRKFFYEEEARPVSLADAFLQLGKLKFAEYPRVPERLTLLYVDDHSVAVELHGRYRVPEEAGVIDTVTFRMFFGEKAGTWDILRMVIECPDVVE